MTLLLLQFGFFWSINIFDMLMGFTLGALRHSLQERLSKGAGVHSSGKIRADEIYLKLRTSTGKILILTFLV